MLKKSNGKRILLICIFFSFIQFTVASNKYLEDSNLKDSFYNKVEEIKLEQDIIEKKIEDEYTAINYTLNNPYIKLNPYDKNQLSALVKFKTPTETRVKLTIKSRTGDPADDIIAVYPASKEHSIKVLALHDDYMNEVVLETDLGSKIVFIQTAKTKNDCYKTHIYDKSKLLKANYLYFDMKGDAYDKYGQPRIVLSSLPSGIFTQIKNDSFQKGAIKIDGFGRVLEIYYPPKVIHHDILVLPNNQGILTLIGPYDVYLIKDGISTKLFDLRDLMTPEQEKVNYEKICSFEQAAKTHWCKRKDWFHVNSLWYQEDDNSLIISARSLLSVIKIGLDDYKIRWIFGPGVEIFKGMENYKLIPTFTDKMLYNYGQHQVSVLPNGNLFMFNNRDWIQNLNSLWQVPGFASGDEYKINEELKTIEHVRSYGLDKKITVQTSGGAQGLPGDKRLILFPNKLINNKRVPKAQYVLYDSEGNEVAEGFLPGYTYRLMAYDVYEGLSE